MREFSLYCHSCKKSRKVPVHQRQSFCPDCNGKLHLRRVLDSDKIKRQKFKAEPPGLWKYLHNIPVDSGHIVSLNEGGTPLRISRLAAGLGLDVRIKDETRNPTGSFLDRGSSVEASICKLLNFNSSAIVNEIAISAAAYSANSGISCNVFIPKETEFHLSQRRLYQLLSYGCELNFVSKRFEVPRDSRQFMTSNTFFFEGLKTCAFEICDQSGWIMPENIIIPIGNGTNLVATYMAIKELIDVGLVGRMPKLHGVTVKSSSLRSDTVAPELAPATPSYLEESIEAINESGGSLIKVSDNNLVQAVSLLGRQDGVFASTSGAASMAGLLKIHEKKTVKNDESMVCVITGSGGISELEPLQKISAFKYLPGSAKDSVQNTQIGETKKMILEILAGNSDYAYNLRRELEVKSQKIHISTLYQHLGELEKSMLITKTKAQSFRGHPTRIYYSITNNGRKILKK